MNHICAHCIEEPFLSNIVAASESEDFVCDFCETCRPAVEMNFVAKLCNDVVETFFDCSSLTPAVLYFNREPAGESIETLLTRR